MQIIVAAQKAYKYPYQTIDAACVSLSCSRPLSLSMNLLNYASRFVVLRLITGLEAQFAMTYFMPFALMMNAILGRVVLLFKALLTRAIEAHGAIALLYLNEVTKANPLRAKVTAVQLRGYQIPAEVIQVANV